MSRYNCPSHKAFTVDNRTGFTGCFNLDPVFGFPQYPDGSAIRAVGSGPRDEGFIFACDCGTNGSLHWEGQVESRLKVFGRPMLSQTAVGAPVT
jgi:hypothetical protein